MNLNLSHHLNDALEVRNSGALLFRYVYAPQTAAVESPKPYFHPLCTLGGEILTGWRPHDHLWHSGLSMTCTDISGQNFWGGPSYEDGDYHWLDNVGRQQHQNWEEIRCDENGVLLREKLDWMTCGGEKWLEETREIRVSQVDEAQKFWRLEVAFHLKNTRGQALEWGSPTTKGRPNAGYGGLFWRGPRSFEGGKILAANDLEGPEIMGKTAPWLAYVGKHDETGNPSTLVFLDQPENPRSPTQWFVRNTIAVVCPSFMFDQKYQMEPDAELVLRYQILLADGAWERSQIEARVSQENA